MKTANVSPVSIYIPHLQAWASVTGACIEDGSLRLICKTDDNGELLLSPDTVQMLFNCFHVPF
ncbi:MAG: hypothetical protein NHB32_25040 [Fischerella sp. CENA71]|nr:hypothetical protein [Fischerella sp. CENA71]TBR56455.1 hypothetical protein B4U84_29690 [Westiellopsis prolifica IICB1]BAZ71287.1 hypothetical protein NIES4106_60840 [Fischerella sp. NIES-4106]